MLGYIAKRILQVIPVIIGVTMATFLLVKIIPGDPVDIMLGPAGAEDVKQQLRLELGFDRPIYVQYYIYMSNLAVGDIGQSFTYGRPVIEVIKERLFNTAILSLSAFLLASSLGIAAGTLAAMRPGSFRDQALSVVILFFNSMPGFWLGLVLILIFGLNLRLLPVGGMETIGSNGGLLDLGMHVILPTLTLTAWSLATIARMTRSSMLEVINSDYVRTARAKGIRESRVILRHALPNAMPQIITVIGLQMGFLLSGAVMTETVFSWPGIGLAMYEAISTRDFPLIQGGILVLSLLFVFINFLVDILYAYFNPKIKYS